jgi:uncharacterized protein (DUF427 family)
MSSQPESVWDYPRPPAVDTDGGEDVRVVLGGAEIARTRQAVRVLETSHPPTYYLPLDAFGAHVLRGALEPHPTFCEFKGVATYWDLVTGRTSLPRAGWSYERPAPGYEALRHHVALMPALLDRAVRPDDGCFVDGERVRPQEGGFYGGWVTSRVRGPFKGAPGTGAW